MTEIHSFADKLAQEQADTIRPEVRRLLWYLFPDAHDYYLRVRELAAQRDGIDVRIPMRDGRETTIDFKFREKVWDDFALEFVHEHDDGHTWPGWVAQPNIGDWIGYVFKPTWQCYLLPRLRLQRAWWFNSERWRREHPIIRARNTDYWSVSCCVPRETLLAAVPGTRITP